MTETRREAEIRLREQAQAKAAQVKVTRRGTPRRLPQMISVRLDPDLATELRQLATERGGTVSDLLREGALRVLESSSPEVSTRVSLVSGPNVDLYQNRWRTRLGIAAALH